MDSWGPAPTSAGMPREGVYPVEFTNVRTNCPFGHKLHSDLNGALNIMRRAIGRVPLVIKKPLSFIVNHNQVAPTKEEVTPKTPGKTARQGRERGPISLVMRLTLIKGKI